MVHQAVPRQRRPEEAAQKLGAHGVQAEEGERRVRAEAGAGPLKQQLQGAAATAPPPANGEPEGAGERQGERQRQLDPQLPHRPEREADPHADPRSAASRVATASSRVSSAARSPISSRASQVAAEAEGAQGEQGEERAEEIGQAWGPLRSSEPWSPSAAPGKSERKGRGLSPPFGVEGGDKPRPYDSSRRDDSFFLRRRRRIKARQTAPTAACTASPSRLKARL